MVGVALKPANGEDSNSDSPLLHSSVEVGKTVELLWGSTCVHAPWSAVESACPWSAESASSNSTATQGWSGGGGADFKVWNRSFYGHVAFPS